MEITTSTPNSSRRHGREERRITKNAAVERRRRRREEDLNIRRTCKLRNPGVQLGGHDDCPGQFGIDLHDDAPRGGVAPVAAIFKAEDDELLVLHLFPHQRLHGTRLRLQSTVLPARSRRDEAGSVDDGEVGAVLVFNFDDDFFGRELARVLLQPRIFRFNICLQCN